MNIAIYQIDPDRDENNVAFLNYENLERFQGSAELRSEIYGTLPPICPAGNEGDPGGAETEDELRAENQGRAQQDT